MNDLPRETSSSNVLDHRYPILVVDDDYHLLQTLQWLLEEEGFPVQTASDGREAVELAVAQRPALIILDMFLPLLNGNEVASQVRSQYGTLVPVILITADRHAEEKSRGMEAVSYLRKPFDFDELIEHVQQALKK